MSVTDECKKVVDQCKVKLRTETNPERRHMLAIVGQEFNDLMMTLGEGKHSKKVFNDAVKKYWK